MIDMKELLAFAVEQNASDIHIAVGIPPKLRINGRLTEVELPAMTPADAAEAIGSTMHDRHKQILKERGEVDFSFASPETGRFRVNVFMDRGNMAAAYRKVDTIIPRPDQLGIPEAVVQLYKKKRGLVLVTGPTGSGKSTTLACIIDQINQNQEKHIITLEDPLEFLHRHNKSIVSQREIHVDTDSYVAALRAALRQSPDVILLGEMRDYETINVAMTAAETGHLLFSTLHTIGAANTIDRIIDVFPPNQQHQIAVQLSMVLNAVVSQQLIPTVDGGVAPAFEIMTVTPAIRNMIRDNKIPQIDGILYSSAKPDMISMDNSLLALYKSGKILKEIALTYATNPDMLMRKL